MTRKLLAILGLALLGFQNSPWMLTHKTNTLICIKMKKNYIKSNNAYYFEYYVSNSIP